LLLKNASALLGPELEYAPSVDILVVDGVFKEIRMGAYTGATDYNDAADYNDGAVATRLHHDISCGVMDCEGLLIIPGLINAHTHIGDSVGKDASLKGSVDDKIHPVMGLKPRILARTPPAGLVGFMRYSCISMLRRGTTTFVDFREGGRDGIGMIKEALQDVPIRSVILGRMNHYQTADEIRSNTSPFTPAMEGELECLLHECDGIGISGANENSDDALCHYSGTGKLRAIHSSETPESVSRSLEMTGKSETVRALALKPHILVHMTHASTEDLRAVAGSSEIRGIVVCPRANSALAEGIPDIITIGKQTGCVLALGTDNVMVNPPDMLREMDYAWKTMTAMHKTPVDPTEVLKMATVNAGRMLGMPVGVIGKGMLADCVMIEKHSLDLEPMHNPHAAVVHRTTESSIRAVMVGGRTAHGKII